MTPQIEAVSVGNSWGIVSIPLPREHDNVTDAEIIAEGMNEDNAKALAALWNGRGPFSRGTVLAYGEACVSEGRRAERFTVRTPGNPDLVPEREIEIAARLLNIIKPEGGAR